MSAAVHEPAAASENPTFVRNSFFSVISGIMSSFAGFASGIIVARILGVSGTGTIAMALWMVFAAVTLSDWGLTGALARFLPPARGNPAETRQVTTYLVWAFWASVASGLLLLAGAMALWWPEAFTIEAWRGEHGTLSFGLIAFCFVIHMANSFGYHYLRGIERFGTIATYSISGSVAQIGIVLVGSMLFGPSGAMIAYIVGSLPLAIITFRLALRGRPIRGDYRRRVTRYSATLWIAGLLSPLLWTRVDLILVERLQGLNAAGLFTAAAAFSALLIQICVMLCGAVLPHLSAAGEQGRRATSSATLKAVLFLLMPMVFGTAAIAPRLIPLVYGPDFASAGLPAVILALAAGGSVITIALSNVMNALDQNAKLVIGGATGCVLTIALGLALIPHYGIMGAAAARFGAQATVACITLYQLNRVQPGTVSWSWFRPIAVASIWCALTAAGILHLWPSDYALILAVPAGGLVYLALCRILLKLDEADIRLLGLKPSSSAGRAASMMTKFMRA
ncbi:oligosaccharide flippase family protein [Sphingobium phenoxybenzoativorans]|uniref:oligosaccharide flippase family protein n=1 Tax=Sphingobium phenoxybenzoativorans TaxID=1592790 RepID=UPI001112ECB8|nr:oligosaccharide flippase family protein [Sphingobium phenoxybenzoativorans]